MPLSPVLLRTLPPTLSIDSSNTDDLLPGTRFARRALNAPDRWLARLGGLSAALQSEVATDGVASVSADTQLAKESVASDSVVVDMTAPKVAPVRTSVASTLPTWLPSSVMNSESDLEALFFNFDGDSDGSLSRENLGSALDMIGFTLSEEYIDALFKECDSRQSGSLTLDDFKKLVSISGFAPSQNLRYAMNLFKQYDDDNSGTIDKFEFKTIAVDIEADQRRRTIVACVAAAAAATVVNRFDDEYQWAQKSFRTLYLEQRAEAAQLQAFPTALLSADFDEAVARTLAMRGYTAANTLFAHSVCSDEVNNKDEELVDLMVSRWQEGFALGGLGGLPFAGKTGFRAYLHHVPDRGRLLVLFAPHVGIDAEGRIGALQRDGQAAVSKACGAGIGAYKALMAKAKAGPAPTSNAVLDMVDWDSTPFDPELEVIINQLGPRIKGIEQASDPIAFVTYQMYDVVRKLIDSCITNTDDVWDWATEVAVVGGVMINRHKGGDFFQPLSFEALRPRGETSVDLYEQAFGKRPDLTTVLGSRAAMASLYDKAPKGKA